LAYSAAASGGYTHIFTTPITGGTPTDITPSGLGATYLYNPSWSPTVPDIAAECVLPSSNSAIVVIPDQSNINTYVTTTPSTYSDHKPVYSPDGSKIAFYRDNTGGAQPGIYIEDATGMNQTLVASLPDGAGVPDSMCWSPFLSAVTYVPNSSFSVNPVSGFVLTQSGEQFGSLLAFTSTTPASATITTSSTQGNEPLIFTLSASAISAIFYTNAYFTYGTTVTPPASTPSALVSIDATTGAVDTVATAAKPLAKFTPSTRSIGSNLVYDGPFTAVYGPKGNRLDTNGANQVVVDGKTGQLVSFN